MNSKFIYIFTLVIMFSISAILLSQTRRTKEDEFTKATFVAKENEQIIHTIKVCDPDGDIVDITLENVPEGMVFYNVYELIDYVPENPEGYEECDEGSSWYALDINWIPTYSQAGTYKIYIHAEDNEGGHDWVNYIITINNSNRPPML